jgi:hypothetical protein
MSDAASVQPFNTKACPIQAQTLVLLVQPWKIVVFSIDRLLITDNPGRLRSLVTTDTVNAVR